MFLGNCIKKRLIFIFNESNLKDDDNGGDDDDDDGSYCSPPTEAAHKGSAIKEGNLPAGNHR